jgi:NAD(P)H-dependent flavin oxidoreductase YrpB (nitropropane dioxygenase family)
VRTRLTEEYGLDVPIVGGALGVLSRPALVAAVSEAGGMGTLGAVGTPLTPPEELRTLIAGVRALTARPFGVNFITPLATPEHVDVCIEAGVPVVSFHWGDPPEALIGRLHDGGVRVWMQAGSAALARAAVDAGVDAVVAQGSEAGGTNRSLLATSTLVPTVADAVAPTMVIAAGGIADGRGLAAALALGAEGAWVGTRLVASVEAYAHEEYKRRVVRAGEADTAVTTVFHGPERLRRPARALRNRVVRTWAGREEHAPTDASAAHVIGWTALGGEDVPIHRFSTLLPTPETTGDFEEMCLLAGESAALVHGVLPAGRIVREMAAEAERVITDRLATMATMIARVAPDAVG